MRFFCSASTPPSMVSTRSMCCLSPSRTKCTSACTAVTGHCLRSAYMRKRDRRARRQCRGQELVGARADILAAERWTFVGGDPVMAGDDGGLVVGRADACLGVRHDRLRCGGGSLAAADALCRLGSLRCDLSRDLPCATVRLVREAALRAAFFAVFFLPATLRLPAPILRLTACTACRPVLTIASSARTTASATVSTMVFFAICRLSPG